jgi:hypothetical protein
VRPVLPVTIISHWAKALLATTGGVWILNGMVLTLAWERSRVRDRITLVYDLLPSVYIYYTSRSTVGRWISELEED